MAKDEKAARTEVEFEASILKTFVDAILPKNETDVYGQGSAGDIWKSMLADQIARQIAKSGAFGVSKRLFATHPFPGQRAWKPHCRIVRRRARIRRRPARLPATPPSTKGPFSPARVKSHDQRASSPIPVAVALPPARRFDRNADARDRTSVRARSTPRTPQIASRKMVDFREFNLRKSQGLLELSASDAVARGNRRSTPDCARRSLGVARKAWKTIAGSCASNLKAVQEVSEIIARTIQAGQSDGTYSAYVWRD